MKVSDLVTFFQSLDQTADVLFAEKSCGEREAFVLIDFNLAEWVTRPTNSHYSKHYKGNVYLLDFDARP